MFENKKSIFLTALSLSFFISSFSFAMDEENIMIERANRISNIRQNISEYRVGSCIKGTDYLFWCNNEKCTIHNNVALNKHNNLQIDLTHENNRLNELILRQQNRLEQQAREHQEELNRQRTREDTEENRRRGIHDINIRIHEAQERLELYRPNSGFLAYC